MNKDKLVTKTSVWSLAWHLKTSCFTVFLMSMLKSDWIAHTTSCWFTIKLSQSFGVKYLTILLDTWNWLFWQKLFSWTWDNIRGSKWWICYTGNSSVRCNDSMKEGKYFLTWACMSLSTTLKWHRAERIQIIFLRDSAKQKSQRGKKGKWNLALL